MGVMGLIDLLRGRRIEAAASDLIPPRPGFETVSPWQDNDVLQRLIVEELYGLEHQPVDRAMAMSLPAVARARHILTTTVARMTIKAMTGHAESPEQPWIVTQPEVNRSRFLTWVWTIDAQIFYGRAWWVCVERDAPSDGGRARRFRLVPEWAGRFDDYGNLVGMKGRQGDFNPADVYRFDGPHEGILNFAGDTIRTAVALQRAAARASSNPVPSIDLHQTGGRDLTDPEIDKLIERWSSARRKASGGVAFTSTTIEARAMGQPPEQLLIDGRKAINLDLARAIGVPAWAVDAPVEGSNLTYSNTPSRSRELLDYGAMAYIAANEGRLSLDDLLPRGQWARFDTTELLRADFKERMEGFKLALDMKLYTLDELRAMERGAPLED